MDNREKWESTSDVSEEVVIKNLTADVKSSKIILFTLHNLKTNTVWISYYVFFYLEFGEKHES